MLRFRFGIEALLSRSVVPQLTTGAKPLQFTMLVGIFLCHINPCIPWFRLKLLNDSVLVISLAILHGSQFCNSFQINPKYHTAGHTVARFFLFLYLEYEGRRLEFYHWVAGKRSTEVI